MCFSQEFARLIKDKKSCIAVYIFSLCLAVSCILPSTMSQGASFSLFASIVASFPVALLLVVVLSAINVLSAKSEGGVKPSLGLSTKACIVSFVCFVLWWSVIAFLSCYPGICSTDTEDIFKMILGMPFESDHFRYDTLNNHHPAFYVFLTAIPFRIASFLGLSQPMAVGLVALFHLLTLALCCSIFQSKLWIMTRSQVFWLLSLAFFLLDPLIVLYSVTLWKDVVFAGFFVVFLIETFALINSGRRFFSSSVDVALLAASILLCLLLRNNAVAAIGIAAIVVLIVLKETRMPVVVLFGSTLLIAALIIGPIYGALGIKSGHFSESISIPLQQVSKVAATEGADMSESQQEYLDELLPFEQYKQRYNPLSPNPIKFSPDFNDAFLEDNKGAFFQTWLLLGVQNPRLYLIAWIDQTKAFWAPTAQTWYVSEPGYSLDGENTIAHNLTNGLISYEQLRTLLDVAVAAFAPFYNSAQLAWLVIFVFLAVILRRQKKLWVSMVPLILWWATFLVATPAVDFRYMFPVHLALPFIFLVLLGRRHSSKQELSKRQQMQSCHVGQTRL